MRIIDIERFDPNWDCIVPADDISDVYKRESHLKENKTLNISLYACSLATAISGAIISNQILRAVAIVFFVAATALLIDFELKKLKRDREYPGLLISKKDIYNNANNSEIFSTALDNVQELAELRNNHSYLRKAISTYDLQNALWSCAMLLGTKNTKEAKEIISNLEEAVLACKKTVLNLEKDQKEIKGFKKTNTDIFTHSNLESSSILRDSAKSLEEGSSEIKYINRNLD